jgi:hypothetical protein
LKGVGAFGCLDVKDLGASDGLRGEEAGDFASMDMKGSRGRYLLNVYGITVWVLLNDFDPESMNIGLA